MEVLKMDDSGLTKLKSIFGFGDDLGFDNFDHDNFKALFNQADLNIVQIWKN